MFELEDGTKMVQSMSIFNYIVNRYGKDKGLIIDDPERDYQGNCTVDMITDFIDLKLRPSLFKPEEEREAIWEGFLQKEYKELMEHLARKLPENSPFYGGFKVSRHDIMIGTFFFTFFLSEGPKHRVTISQKFIDQVPARVT